MENRNTESATWLSKSLFAGKKRDVKLFAIFAVAVASMFIAYIARMHDVTHDAFHEMALAREWFTTGQFPTEDVFAYTSTVTPTVHHEWATGVVLYVMSALSPFGFDGMIVMKMILTILLGITLYRVARGNGAHPILFFLLVPIVFPVLWVGFATLRAQLFTLVALALQMLMLQSDWRGKRSWILFWVPLYVVWLNLHAGFVVGLGLLGFHLIERIATTCWREYCNSRSKWESSKSVRSSISYLIFSKALYQSIWNHHWHLFALGPAIVAGLYCNPWGWQYAWYLAHAITMPRPTILEWKPIWFTHDPIATLITFGFSVFLIVYSIRERRWERLRGCCFCLLAAYMALKHIRHGSIYGVVWIAMVPGWLTPTPWGRSMIELVQATRSSWTKMGGLAIALSLMFALAQPFYRATLPTSEAPSTYGYPIAIVDYLENHQIHGNVMTPFHCGAYVSWRLYPSVKVSLDGRYEVAYQPQVMEQHAKFYEALDGWQEILVQYEHDFLIVPKDAAIYSVLKKSVSPEVSKWKAVFEDNSFALFGIEQIKS